MSEIDPEWLNANMLGRNTIEALVECGMLKGLPEDSSRFEQDHSNHELTMPGQFAIRDDETVRHLEELRGLIGDGPGDFAPSRREFVALVDITRCLLIEVIKLRGASNGFK